MNLLFIAIDTLRSDHLACYGYPRPTSPCINAMAESGVLFEQFHSVGNCTHPGFTAMLTGLFPESSQIVSHWTRMELSKDTPTMAEYFARAGYQTAAIDNLYDGWTPKGHPHYPWFRRGYEYYDYPRNEGFYQPAAQVAEMAGAWMEKEAKPPFLLFVHIWNPHAPYNKAPKEFYRFYDGDDPCDPRLDFMPPNVRAPQRNIFDMPITDPNYVVAAYDAEIAYTDHAIGMLLEKLDDLERAHDTVVLITSDHGEIMARPRLALGRPWCFSHIGLHEDNLHVPLIITGGPAKARIRVKERFQLVDIVPTLIEMFDLSEEKDLDGTSLVPALKGETLAGRDAIFVSENTYQKQRAAMRWPWKYMRMEEHYDAMPPRCLYNLDTDPNEMINLVDDLRDQAAEMDSLLTDYIAPLMKAGEDPLLEQDITYRFPPPAITKY
ncbi:MAG: sulfatase [Planctomycetes bacterium]|nr:sulfatase [Planctomycetota bacterium]